MNNLYQFTLAIAHHSPELILRDIFVIHEISGQWPLKDPNIRPFFRPMFQGIYQNNMARHIVLTYLHLLDPEDLPLNYGTSH